MITYRIVFFAVLYLIFVVSLAGCRLESSKEGDDSNVLNVPSQYSTIQSAIDVAAVGNIIRVAAGTYNENLSIKNNITIEGGGPAVTIIRGLGNDAVILDSEGFTGSFIIGGFTIENGTKGISLTSAIITLSDCVITNNTEEGLYLSFSTATISNCRISSNGSDGIYAFSSTPTISNTIINSNSGDGIYLGSSQAGIHYSTVTSNTDTGIYSTGSTAMIKNSIISNHVSRNGVHEDSSALTLSNLDFWNNGCDWEENSTCHTDTADYNAINSILTDPLFVSPPGFHLQPGSPALTASDAGGEIGAYGNDGSPP